MTDCNHKHTEKHDHVHGSQCGHTAIQHDDHVDYLHNGHLHHLHGDHYDDHQLSVTEQNPERCTPEHQCDGHDQDHIHGVDCGHEAIPHGDHIDYLVNGHLHHPHGDHCDDHGSVTILEK